MKQQLIALALSTALLAGSAAAAIAPEEAFPAVNTYPGFADVAGSAWYAATVQTCYEVGLMTGTGAGFAPDQVLTVGEVAAIAARMNEAITGDSIYLVDSTLPWYASYVDYLEKLGVEILRTDEDGTVLIASGGHGLELWTGLNSVEAKY